MFFFYTFLLFCFLGCDGGCLFSTVSADFTVVSVVISTVDVSIAVSFVNDFVSIAGAASDAVVLGGYYFFLVTWVHPSSRPL